MLALSLSLSLWGFSAGWISTMTEYWVSQGNKWCDFCKIFISNNPLSVRNHELGKRHKDNVAARLDNMRKESAAKEKEKKVATKALEQIESKAQRSYMKDLESFEKDKHLVERMPPAFDKDPKAWVADDTCGYYYNTFSGYFYDPKSRLYFSDEIGEWVNREKLYTSGQTSIPVKPKSTVDFSQSTGGPPPGPVIPKSQAQFLSKQPDKGATSSAILSKRKREDEKKPKTVSKEEMAALKAREEARKRVEEREKNLLGLYKSY